MRGQSGGVQRHDFDFSLDHIDRLDTLFFRDTQGNHSCPIRNAFNPALLRQHQLAQT
jgi:hypothetical protein